MWSTSGGSLGSHCARVLHGVPFKKEDKTKLSADSSFGRGELQATVKFTRYTSSVVWSCQGVHVGSNP